MFSRKKVVTLTFLGMAFASSAVSSQDVSFIVKSKPGDPEQRAGVIKFETPEWVVQSTDAGPWVNVGEATDCSEWAPAESLVDQGESFTQNRSCSQEQSRQLSQVLYSQRLNQTRTGEATTENQTVTLAQSQSAVGTKPTEPVCTYSGSGVLSSVSSSVHNSWGTYTTTYTFRWGGSNVGSVKNLPVSSASVTNGGFRYTIGSFVRNTGSTSKAYRICRVPV